MAIDKEKLISLLVDKTELDREKVEEQLSELVQRIQTAAEEGKSFEIEGFGTFSMEDDDLTFTPSERLETEINNKYAGMKPIELIGAFKEPETDVDEADEETEQSKDVWAFDEEASEVFGLEESETESHSKDFADELTESEVGSKKSEKTQSLTRSEKTTKEESDPIGRVLMVAVVLIIFGAGGWLIYDMNLIGSSNSNDSSSYTNQSAEESRIPAQQTGDTQGDEAQATSDTGNDASDETSEPEQDMQVTKQGDTQSEPDDEAEQQDQSPYGLKGEFDNSISSGYMIVVHSLRKISDAEENKQRLQEDGYRTTINRAVVDGIQYHRVGIGQFPTIEAAQQAINQLPEPYKSNNFIKRIR
jgi:cell division septation protein DedD